MKKIIDNLIYVAFLGYIAFIPSGPYPIPILGTKLDVFFGFLLLFLIIPKIIRIGNYYPKMVVFSLWIYVITTYLSVVFSDDQYYSLGEWSKSLGYTLICFLAPTFIYSKIRTIRFFLLSIGSLISLILIYMTIFLGFTGRIYLGMNNTEGALYNETATTYTDNLVDPNMTAIGLMMSLIICIPIFLEKAYIRNIFNILAFAVITIGILLTLSRTAVVSFFISLVISSLLLKTRAIGEKIMIKYIIRAVIIFIILSCFSFATYQLFPNFVESIVQRLSNSGFTEDEHRVSIMFESFEIFNSNDKNILFGKGFFMTNPHNELLRYLSSSGLIGLIGFTFLLTVFYISIVKKIKANYWLSFCATSLFIFILLASQTYGHTKSLWSSLMFVCIFYLENKFENEKYIKTLMSENLIANHSKSNYLKQN